MKEQTSVKLIESGWEGHLPGILRCLAVGGKLYPAAQAAKEVELAFSGGVIKWVEKAAVSFTTVIAGIPKLTFLQDGLDVSALDAMIKAGAVRQAPLNTPLAIKTGDIAPNGRLIGQPVAVKSLTLESTVLEAWFCGFIIILTKELARAGGRELEAYLNRVAQIAMATGTDQQAFGALINSSTPSDTESTIPAAIQTAIQNLRVSSSSKVYLLMSPDFAKNASSLMTATGAVFPDLSVTGGRVGGHVALRSAAMTGNSVAAVDADQLIANVGEIEVDVSDEADIVMKDDPTPGASTVVSLFQSNSSGVRCLRKFGLAAMRQDAISIATVS